MIVPRNVWRFEVLMYLSLIIDALSTAFRDDAFSGIADESLPAAKLTTAALIVFFAWLVWLAAHGQKNWARLVLLAALVLSTMSLVAAWSETGLDLDLGGAADILSTALTALGLYFSFTGDAKGWFRS